MVSPNVVKRIPIAIGIKPSQEVEFTNKTIDGTLNTLQNIPTGALQYDSITINGTTVPLGGSLSIQAINPGAIPDYSSNPLAPTPISYEEGHLNIEGDVVSGDVDYVTFTVGASPITSLYLTHYSDTENDGVAFFAIQAGAAWTVGQDTTQMIAFSHFGPNAPAGYRINENVLSGQGAVLSPNTTYTMWIQQTGTALTRYTFSTNLLYPGSWALTDTNTTYTLTSSSIAAGANLNLVAGGSGTGTESVPIQGGGNVTVSRQNDGTILISDGGALGGVSITDSSTNTLTNKTISGSDNTLSNIPNTALSNSFITINGEQVSLGGSVTIAGGGGGTGDLTATGIATLTNKTISGSNNTITDLPNSALTNPFISINGNQVSLGQDFTVGGLGDVTTTGTQDLSNKSLLAPVIQGAKITGTFNIGTAGGGNPGTAGQVLKSTGTGVQWANESQTTAAALTIGSGLISSSGQSDFDGSNGTTISVNTGIVATLTGTQTLTNKTLTGPNLTGDLKVNNVSGTAGQTIVSDGAGGLAWGAGGGGGSGSFNGPATSTDNAILRYDGTTGDLALDSLVTISDTGVITAPSVASVIPFYHASVFALPTASNVNGAVAVSAGDNSLYFASNGNWTRVASESEAVVQTRASFSTTTASLGNNGVAYPNITDAYKSYLLLKIQVDRAAWVRVYTSSAARSADANRSIDVDPAPGSGVLAEIITTGAQTQVLTPTVIGFNDDSTPVDTIYLAVTNRSGTTGTVTVTLTALKLEA